MNKLLPLLLFSFLWTPLRAETKTAPAHPSQKWEKDIAAFEEADQKSPPPQNGIEFIGSDGKPNDALYVEDKLHNNAAGYKIRVRIVKAYLEGK